MIAKKDVSPNRKSGYLTTSNKLQELESKMEEKMKEIADVEKEKEFVQRKVHNFRNSVGQRSPNISKINESEMNDELKTHNNVEYKLEDIVSDCDRNSMLGELSDCTSVASSSASNMSDSETGRDFARTTETRVTSIDPKQLYKDFVKLFLKVKFETLHSQHKGQKIPQSTVWKEVQRKGILKSNWEEFIIEELKNPAKYDKTSQKKIRSRAPDVMDTIKEEI